MTKAQKLEHGALVAVITKTLREAFAAPLVGPVQGCGCGRAYVCVYGVDKPVMKAFEAAAKALDKIFQRKAYYGLTNALYIGYDNSTGRELARARTVAEYLTSHGIPAYDEACGG